MALCASKIWQPWGQADHATAPEHRRRLRQIDLETTVYVADPDAAGATGPQDIVVEASVNGLPSARITIPVTTDLGQLPLAVASRSGMAGAAVHHNAE